MYKPSFKIENNSFARVYFRALVTIFILTFKCIEQGRLFYDRENQAHASLLLLNLFLQRKIL